MARETLKDFLTTIGSSADRIDFVRKGTPDGLGVDPNTGEELLDLLSSTKGLLGDYLNHITADSRNTYGIESGNELAATSNRGDSLPLADDQGATNIFVPQGTEKAAKLNEYSNSQYLDSAGQSLYNLIDKTANSGHNHDLLSDIEGSPLDTSGKTNAKQVGESNITVLSTQNVFLKNNRFSNVSPHAEGGTTGRAFAPNDGNTADFEGFDNNAGTIMGQKVFGQYNKTDHKTSFNRLRNVAGSLLLRSTGFTTEGNPLVAAASSEFLKLAEGAISEGTNNSSNITDTGFNKRDFTNLRARNQLGFPEEGGKSIRDGRGDFLGVDPEANNAKSFGSTYNQVMQFDGVSRKVVKIQAAIAILALKSVSKTFFDSFKQYLKGEDKKSLEKATGDFLQSHDQTHVGLLMLGHSRKMSSLLLDAGLFKNILTATTYPYTNCVDRGLEIAFSTETDPEKIANHPNFAQSPGFWFAVAKSVLKSYDNIVNRLSQIDSASFKGPEITIVMREIIGENNFFRFLNAMAVIGDISLQSTNALLSETNRKKVKHPRDVDSYENKPGNRVGKSRVAKGKTTHSPFDSKAELVSEETLAWEQSATPSTYLLPVNVIRAANMLNNTVYGANPMRGMLGSRMVRNTYFSLDVDGTFNRMPQQLVKVIEDKLEAEYVPFYFHDLRTNEILSFHAFLTQLTDAYNVNFNAVNGYGRIDPVQIYNGTTRTVNVGFTVYATNREDFDEMWYKINKFVTLLYPQWTQGTMVANEAGNFYQPFSQVIGASPIVRLRVGDVIKSNYSRFALARIFGIGDKEVQARPVDNSGAFGIISTVIGAAGQTVMNTIRDVLTTIYLILMGSPIGLVVAANQLIPGESGLAGTAKRIGTQAAIQGLSNVLVNGFVNPLAMANVITDLRDPNVFDGAGMTQTGQFGKQIIIKANNNTGYFSPDDNKKYFTNTRLRGRVMGQETVNNDKTVYKVVVESHDSPLSGLHLLCSHQDVLIEPGEHFRTSVGGITGAIAGLDIIGLLDTLAKPGIGQIQSGAGRGAASVLYGIARSLLESPESSFMDAANNPFVRAYETTKGRGLAGVIKGISFDWLDDAFPWETDYNARAPKGVKISFAFDVIHDIPPGLGHDGFNRAPLYNVGEIMRNVAGDTWGDNGDRGEDKFVEGRESRTTGEKRGKK